MASERNRVLELKKYLSLLGISVNIGKNKARGHKGIFMHRFDMSRIDISNEIRDDDKIISVILHEFAHYIHHTYDKKLCSLDFIFGNFTDELKEELIKITVKEVPKETAKTLFAQKENLNNEIKDLLKKIKILYPQFKQSEKNLFIENGLPEPIKYLLRYDRVNYYNQLYSIDKLCEYSLEDIERTYILIKSKQRALSRINSRISRINKYYNNPSELFARFVDSYYTNPTYTKKVAPCASEYIKETNIKFFQQLNNIFGV